MQVQIAYYKVSSKVL